MRSFQESQQPAGTLNIPAWAFVLIASCLAAVLASLFLDAKSFWLDEASSVEFAGTQHHLGQVAVANGGNFAVYYIMLHAWLWFGSSDVYVRLLSVIPAVLAVACVFALGRRLFGPRAGAIAAFALALNPFFIAYAQEARGYSLLLLASIVSTLFFVRLVQRPGSRLDLLLYVFASVLMVYTHLFGVFVLAAQAAALLLVDRRLFRWRTIAISAIAITVLLLPLAFAAHRQGAGGIEWIPPVTPHTIVGVFQALAGGLPLLIFYVALAAYGVVRGFRNRVSHDSPDVAAFGLILTWLFVPIALAVIVSQLVTPIVIAHYFIICLAPLALLAGAILSRIRTPAIFATASFLFVALSSLGLWHYYFQTPKEDWRGAAGYIVAHFQPGDAVVCSPPWTIVPLRHAIDRLPRVEQSPLRVERLPLNPDGWPNPRSAAMRSFVVTLGRQPRVWLILSGHDVAERFQNKLSAQTTVDEDTLLSHKRLSMQRSFVNIDVRLYSERE